MRADGRRSLRTDIPGSLSRLSASRPTRGRFADATGLVRARTRYRGRNDAHRDCRRRWSGCGLGCSRGGGRSGRSRSGGSRSRYRGGSGGGRRCRLRGRRGRRYGVGGGRRGRRRRGRRPLGEKREGIDVRLAVGEPDTEMDVSHVVLGVTGGTRLRDRVAFLDPSAATYEERPEMRQRCLVAGRGDDRDRRPVRRYLTCEGHLAGHGRANDRCAVEGDVDAAVLAARVRVVADGVATEDGALRRPRPRERVGGRNQRPGERGHRDDERSGCPMSQHGTKVAAARASCRAIDEVVTERRGRAGSVRCR